MRKNRYSTAFDAFFNNLVINYSGKKGQGAASGNPGFWKAG
jgi:hypothetical protein